MLYAEGCDRDDIGDIYSVMSENSRLNDMFEAHREQ